MPSTEAPEYPESVQPTCEQQVPVMPSVDDDASSQVSIVLLNSGSGCMVFLLTYLIASGEFYDFRSFSRYG